MNSKVCISKLSDIYTKSSKISEKNPLYLWSPFETNELANWIYRRNNNTIERIYKASLSKFLNYIHTFIHCRKVSKHKACVTSDCVSPFLISCNSKRMRITDYRTFKRVREQPHYVREIIAENNNTRISTLYEGYGLARYTETTAHRAGWERNVFRM